MLRDGEHRRQHFTPKTIRLCIPRGDVVVAVVVVIVVSVEADVTILLFSCYRHNRYH